MVWILTALDLSDCLYAFRCVYPSAFLTVLRGFACVAAWPSYGHALAFAFWNLLYACHAFCISWVWTLPSPACMYLSFLCSLPAYICHSTHAIPSCLLHNEHAFLPVSSWFLLGYWILSDIAICTIAFFFLYFIPSGFLPLPLVLLPGLPILAFLYFAWVFLPYSAASSP
jgi:hypothetical protein